MGTDSFQALATVKFNNLMQPCADAIYDCLFQGCTIRRLAGKAIAVDPLDSKFGIDVMLRLPNGILLTVQEKFRRAEYRRWNEFTLEYYNNPATREEGEWFHLCADLYFYAYANPECSGWTQWYLFKVSDLKLALARGKLQMNIAGQNYTHSRANFRALAWSKIPREWIIASGGNEGMDGARQLAFGAGE